MVGANPAIRSPPTKVATPVAMGGSGPFTSLHRPPRTVAITLAARVALKARLYRGIPPRSAATTGMAVATAMASKAVSMMSATRPILKDRYFRERTPAGTAASTVIVMHGKLWRTP